MAHPCTFPPALRRDLKHHARDTRAARGRRAIKIAGAIQIPARTFKYVRQCGSRSYGVTSNTVPPPLGLLPPAYVVP